MEISDRPFDKIAIDLVTECETSTLGNKHILTITDHLIGWSEAFTIPDKSADTIVSTFINEYLPAHMCPWYILLDNGWSEAFTIPDKSADSIVSTFINEYLPAQHVPMVHLIG